MEAMNIKNIANVFLNYSRPQKMVVMVIFLINLNRDFNEGPDAGPSLKPARATN
jgi:hypothetical protein